MNVKRKFTVLCAVIGLLLPITGAATAATKPSPSPSHTTLIFPPKTSASILTQPPLNMEGINDYNDIFFGGMDPEWVTLGPKHGLTPDVPSYAGKLGVNVEIPDGAPVLAPIDMKFVGFKDMSAKTKIVPGPDPKTGEVNIKYSPMDDLRLCFESTSKDWPGLIICIYHLKNSPLLLAFNKNKLCSRTTLYDPNSARFGGWLFYPENDLDMGVNPGGVACQSLLGRKIKRGQVIGYTGSVGEHSQAPIQMKVPDRTINPLVKNGDVNLHWVQGDAFFYWKCYSPKAVFEPGVLGYPWECNGYKVPAAQRTVTYKYPK